MEKSNSNKVRNILNELSHIESLMYKKHFLCLKSNNELLIKEINNINNPLIIINKLTKINKICKEELNQNLYLIKDNIKKYSYINANCLSNCTDLLNYPSEELTCYDKCESEYVINLNNIFNILI